MLAIWNDCRSDWLDAYESWYQSEHLPERLSIPGFLRGRRYAALTPGPGFLTCYDVSEPNVLRSKAYRARLDAPTPQTNRMMRHAFQNVSRTICRRTTIQVGPTGDCCVAAVTGDCQEAEALAKRVAADATRRVDLWTAVENENQAPSAEETLRGRDARIRACLFIEVTGTGPATRLAQALGGQAFQLISEMVAHQREDEQ